MNYYGIAGTELQLLTNYLQNRKQYVIFNNHESELTDITTGVPQGSILGPLLFSIIINDLKKISKKLRFFMYADDTTIYFNLEDFDSNNFEIEINAELQKVSLWIKKNKLSLNLDKTKLMIFQQKRVKELNIIINDTNIERVQSFNFLGITLSENMSSTNHVLSIKKKISKVIGILYRLRNTFPLDVLKTLYKSLVLSYINYGLLLWGIEVKKLESIQKRAIRLITSILTSILTIICNIVHIYVVLVCRTVQCCPRSRSFPEYQSVSAISLHGLTVITSVTHSVSHSAASS